MNVPSVIPVIKLTPKQTLCLLTLKEVIFNSEHLKEKTVSEVSEHLEFLFTKEMVDEVLELNNKSAKQEIQLIIHGFH